MKTLMVIAGMLMFATISVAAENTIPNTTGPGARNTNATDEAAQSRAAMIDEKQAANDQAEKKNENDKEAFTKKMGKRIDNIEENIDDLKDEAKEASGKTRDNLMKKIGALETRRDDMKKQLEKIEDASGAAWKRMRGGLENAWMDMKRAFKNAQQDVRQAKNKEEANDKQ
jgi:hypothetical protein